MPNDAILTTEAALASTLTSWRLAPLVSSTFACATVGGVVAIFLPPWGRSVAIAISILPWAWMFARWRNPLLKTRSATLSVRADGLYVDGARVARPGARLDVVRDMNGMVILCVGSLGRAVEAILPDEETAAGLAAALQSRVEPAALRVACVYSLRASAWGAVVGLFAVAGAAERGSPTHLGAMMLVVVMLVLVTLWDTPGRIVIDDEAIALRHLTRRRRLARREVVGARALFAGGVELDLASGGHVDLDVAWKVRLPSALAELAAARVVRSLR